MSQELEQFRCSDGSLRGSGLAGDYDQALDNAVNQIAVQIQSSVTSVSKMQTGSKVDADGRETLNSSFERSSQVQAQLRNRQDVHVLQTVARDGVVGVVACMDKGDAARPYRDDYQNARNALVSAVSVLNVVTHPLEKFGHYDTMVEAYGRYREATQVLQSLGFSNDLGEIEDSYRKALESYVDFKSRYKIYMDGAIETVEGKVVVEQLSKDIKFQSLEDSCTVGLVLELEIAPPKCKEGSLGISCSEMVALYGKSCGGETYFTLGGTFKGTGRMSEEEAVANLQKNVERNGFVGEWKKEIERWIAR